MHSQIGQTTSGQTSNPLLAAIGKENGSHQDKRTRDHDSFQSVLADASEPASKDIKDEHGAVSTDDAADSDNVQDEELTNANQAEAEDDDTPAFFADDADEIIFKPKEAGSPLKSNDVVQLVAEMAKTMGAKGGAEVSAQQTGEIAPSGKRAKANVPAWFSTSRGAEPMGQAGNAVGQSANASSILASASTHQAGEAQKGATSADEAALRTMTATDTPGHQGRQDTKGGEKAALSMAQFAGQAIKTEEEPKHVIERRLGSEEAAPTFATQRNAAATTPGQQAFAAPVQVAARPMVQGAPVEERGIRWMSEAGFASEIAAQDLPATSRVQQTALLQQPDLPRNIAVQIAQAMRQGGADRPMELVLSPAELGRVRISLQAGDGAMTVHVLADRPETLDLMRRHIDLLAQEFHDIGYGSAEFAFGQNAPDGGTQGEGENGSQTMSANSSQNDVGGDQDTAAPTPLTLQSDRVDIRL